MVGSRQLIIFKSHDKYISLTKTVLTNIKIYFMRKSSTTIICHLVANVYTKLPERKVKNAATCTARYLITVFRIKKKLDGKFSKSSVKNFKI